MRCQEGKGRTQFSISSADLLPTYPAADGGELIRPGSGSGPRNPRWSGPDSIEHSGLRLSVDGNWCNSGPAGCSRCGKPPTPPTPLPSEVRTPRFARRYGIMPLASTEVLPPSYGSLLTTSTEAEVLKILHSLRDESSRQKLFNELRLELWRLTPLFECPLNSSPDPHSWVGAPLGGYTPETTLHDIFLQYRTLQYNHKKWKEHMEKESARKKEEAEARAARAAAERAKLEEDKIRREVNARLYAHLYAVRDAERKAAEAAAFEAEVNRRVQEALQTTSLIGGGSAKPM